MSNETRPLPLSAYKTQIPGYKQVGDKYQGVIGCSLTGLATDESYFEFISDQLCDTPEKAMDAARDLHYKLAALDPGQPESRHADYKGHAIVVATHQTPIGRFQAVFSVHSAERSEFKNFFHLVHQEKGADGMTCDTEADAIDDARARAKAWIDAQD